MNKRNPTTRVNLENEFIQLTCSPQGKSNMATIQFPGKIVPYG